MKTSKCEKVKPPQKDTSQGKTLCEVFMSEREENLTRFWVETEDEFWVRVFSQIEKQKEGW